MGGPEPFCKLVEHVRRRPGDRIQCGVCDDAGGPAERHPIEFAVDGSNRWWQSPTIANGRQFNRVSVVLDLKQVFIYLFVEISNEVYGCRNYYYNNLYFANNWQT